MSSIRLAFASALAAAACCIPAVAQEPVKIGMVAPFSGVAADYGRQMEAGMRTWLRMHGDTVISTMMMRRCVLLCRASLEARKGWTERASISCLQRRHAASGGVVLM